MNTDAHHTQTATNACERKIKRKIKLAIPTVPPLSIPTVPPVLGVTPLARMQPLSPPPSRAKTKGDRAQYAYIRYILDPSQSLLAPPSVLHRPPPSSFIIFLPETPPTPALAAHRPDATNLSPELNQSNSRRCCLLLVCPVFLLLNRSAAC